MTSVLSSRQYGEKNAMKKGEAAVLGIESTRYDGTAAILSSK